MDCAPYSIELPAIFSGDTWDGLTWTVSDVADGETEFSGTLTTARFQLQDSDGTVALTLTSETQGQVTINTATSNAWSVTVEPRALTVAEGVYSFGLETTDDSGIVKIQIAGTLPVFADPVK